MDAISTHLLADGPASHGDVTTWIALGAGMLLFAYVVLRPRSKKDPLERASSLSAAGLAQQRAVERQMNTLLVELSEMWRTISAGIDTRAAKLQVLMDEADRRISLLEQLQHAAGQTMQRPLPAPTNERAALLAPMTEMPASELTEAAPETAAAVVHRIEPEPPEEDPAHSPIYRLSEEGRSIVEIATLLDRQRGEVELILALRPTPPRSMTG